MSRGDTPPKATRAGLILALVLKIRQIESGQADSAGRA